MVRTLLCAGMVSATAAVGLAEASEIPVAQDYMTSGFFQSNFVRGQEPGSTRASNRATSETIFGVTGETAYFSFDFDPSLFSGAVPKATFVVESVSTGFFTDPSPGNPTEVSIHSLTADPLASIDINAPSGPGSWIDFRDSQITTSSIVTTTSVDGLGVFEWDITSLVNEWIANGDSNFAYTIGTSALLDEEGEAAVAFVNSSWDDLSDEVTARIVVIPAPGVGAVLAAAGLVCTRRRRS
ncbi:MAG: hypothetical protein AAF297_00475 [Planctomycetota bacterium]